MTVCVAGRCGDLWSVTVSALIYAVPCTNGTTMLIVGKPEPHASAHLSMVLCDDGDDGSMAFSSSVPASVQNLTFLEILVRAINQVTTQTDTKPNKEEPKRRPTKDNKQRTIICIRRLPGQKNCGCGVDHSTAGA